MKALKLVVLVTEDEEVVREYIERIITEKLEGFEVLKADCAEKAEKIAKQHPDIVLLVIDLVLPGGCYGPKLASRLHELLKWETPVLFITGHDAQDPFWQGQTNGELILQKPFVPSKFIRYLKCAFRGTKEVAPNL